MKYALLGGIVWNFGNIFLTAAIAVAGMSIGFPIGGGLAWIGGIIFNYLLITLAGEVYPGNQALLWIGVVVIIVAICICGKAYGKMSASQASTPKKVSYWLLWQDWPSCFLWIGCKITRSPVCCGWYGNTDSLYRRILLCRRCPYHYSHFNTFAMSHPAQGNKVTMKDYLKGDTRTHLIGMLGGFIWMSGMVVSFMGAGSANPAIAYALSNAAPVVAMIWGFFVWKEFKGAPKGTVPMIATMFVLFVVGLVLITLSN